jgi:hypothetical protein
MFKKFEIKSLFKTLIFLGLLVLVFIIFCQKIEFTSVDLGRHLANGRELFNHPDLLFKNTYSYTEPNFPFINHHWLAGLIYYKLYLVGGFKILSLFNILTILLTFSLAFFIAKKRAGFYLSAVLSLPFIFLLSERVEVRPEIFSYLFILLTWFVLENFRDKKWHGLIYLIPLFFLWVNIHIYFFIGLALIGFKAAAEFLPSFLELKADFKSRFVNAWFKSKQYFINLGILILVCLLNPNTIYGLLYPFNIFHNYAYEIAENKSIFYLGHLMFNQNFAIFKLGLLLLILSFSSVIFFKKKINYFDLLISIFFSVLALLFSRNLSIFSLVAFVIIAGNLKYIIDYLKKGLSFLDEEFLKNKIHYDMSYGAALLLLIIIISAFYLNYDSKNNHGFIKSSLGLGVYGDSTDSINFFESKKLSGPVFNNYDIGSALIFWLYPKEQVFVDNRPEAYSNNFFTDIYKPMQLDRSKWDEFSAKYKFKTIYFSHTDSTPWAQSFLRQILQDQNWALVYFDNYSVILVNKKTTDEKQWQNNTIDIWTFRKHLRELVAKSDLRGKFHLASLAENANYPDLAEEVYQDILIDKPGNFQALASLAYLYSGSSEQSQLLKSLDYFSLALSAGYELPGIYNQMGMVNWQLGRYTEAESFWKKALKIDSHDASALYYLDQVRQLRLQGNLIN